MGHLLTLVCNVQCSKKYPILVEAILKSRKGVSSGYFVCNTSYQTGHYRPK